MKRLGAGIAVLIGVGSLTGCGGDESFATRDPAGYKACSLYAEYQANSSSTVKLGGMLEVGKQARKAGTKEIRDSVKALFDEEALEMTGQEDDFPMVDKDKFEKACTNAGFEF